MKIHKTASLGETMTDFMGVPYTSEESAEKAMKRYLEFPGFPGSASFFIMPTWELKYA